MLPFSNFILICTSCDHRLKLCISGVNVLLDMSPVSKAWSTFSFIRSAVGEERDEGQKAMEFSDVFSTRTGVFFFFLTQAFCHPGRNISVTFLYQAHFIVKKQTLTVVILQSKERNKNILYKWLTKNSTIVLA